MKTINNSHFQLASTSVSSIRDTKSKRPDNDEVESIEKAALSLLSARTTGRISPATIDKFISVLQTAKCPHTIVQRSVDVFVYLLNKEGDASICFKYDIANFGHKSLPSRTHRFWFTTPQPDINISVFTDSELPLKIENIESSPNFKEIRVHFPSVLEPAAIIKYRIQYQLKKDFLGVSYYDITARTLTQKVSLSLYSPEQSRFDMMRVGLESADGYISDCPPLISVATEGGREKLTWQSRHSKTGDQFRTHWSLV